MNTILLLIAALAPSADASLKKYQSSEVHMGTSFAISLYAENPAAADKAMKAAFARVAALDGMLSDYRPDSELNQLSQAAPTAAPIHVSSELVDVLVVAQSLSKRTDGAFDVTVGPLTKLWRRARRRKEFPSPERLAEAREAVGFRFMKVHPESSSVELTVPNMRLDLGAIAKGYAGDEALRVLRKHGITRALVNAGGDVVASDAPPGETGWRIGIAPLQPDSPPSRFLRLANAAAATSGDAWQYVELNGKRYSHILDPRTGLGLTTRSSVTVVAPTGIIADSLASAVSVLGEKAGLRVIAETPETESLIVRVVGGVATTIESPGLRCLTE